MATTLTLLLIIFSLFLHVSNATYVLPIFKDTKNSQYFTTFQVGTSPSTRVFLVIDLSNQWSWFACDLYGYSTTSSSTSSSVRCGSRKCELYGGQRTFCGGDTCGAYTYTRWSNGLYGAGLDEDTITLYRYNQTKQNSLPQLSKSNLPRFPFSCADKGPLKGLSRYTKGVVTLASVPNSLHSQISSTLKIPRKFSLCLPTNSSLSSSGYNGVIYFGDSPNYLSRSLITTPILVNPTTTAPISASGEPSIEYFIKVRSIKVDKTPVRFNSSLLSLGGCKISTLDPYTVLHSHIYKALIDVFVTKASAMKMARVAPVAPFGACFSEKTVVNNAKMGLIVPIIDMILDGRSPLLHNKNARWRIYGANSMVMVSKNVVCLGFVDGGLEPMTSIVIGGKQMEDNLVEFDLESNKLGVTSSLLRMGTSCSTFKGM